MTGLEQNPVPYLRDCLSMVGHGRLIRGFKECSVTVNDVRVRRQKGDYPAIVTYSVSLADGTTGRIVCTGKRASWLRSDTVAVRVNAGMLR